MTTVLGNDARNALRDRTIGALLFVPLIFLVLLRFGFPLLRDHVPAAGDYAGTALSLFCGIAATFPAFMMAFLMLDERDQHVVAVLRVLPVPWTRIIAYRAAAVTLVGMVNSALLIFGSGLNTHSVAGALLLAALSALIAPMALLLVVSLADNKIEGLTLFKGLFFILFLAAAAQSVTSDWRFILGIVPPFWTYSALAGTTAFSFIGTAGASLVTHLAAIGLATRRLIHS